jgi:hypothetical protein
MIDDRLVTPEGVARMANCRLRQTHRTLNELLMLVEREMESRKEALK